MLKVEIVPTTGNDLDKRTLGGVVYIRTPIRISWENERGFVKMMFGTPVWVHDRSDHTYDGSMTFREPPLGWGIATFCDGMWFSKTVELAKGAEEFVFLDRTRTRLEARDGFLLQYYAYANMTEVDVYAKVEN